MKKFYESPLFEAVELATLPIMLSGSVAQGGPDTAGGTDAPVRHGIGGFALKQL